MSSAERRLENHARKDIAATKATAKTTPVNFTSTSSTTHAEQQGVAVRGRAGTREKREEQSAHRRNVADATKKLGAW